MIAPVERTGELLAALAAQPEAKTPGVSLVRTDADVDVHPFTADAAAVTKRVREMTSFVSGVQRRYADFSVHGMRDGERDEVDAAVAAFLKEVMAVIDRLKGEAVEELERGGGRSFPAHKLGVVVVLNEDLQVVSKISEGLRGVRIRHAIAEKSKPAVVFDAAVAEEMAAEARTKNRELEDGDEADFAMFEQEFARENATLVNELVETRERVREAERTVFEIANLNHVFATKVLEQAREIEVLYDLAVEATGFVERGNKELRKMTQRGPVLKYGVAGFVLFLAFGLLFLDWMKSRRSLFFI